MSKNECKKKLFSLKPNLWDLAILLMSLIIASVLLTVVNIRNYQASLDTSAKVAHVYYNGNEIKQVDLSSLESDYVFTMDNSEYPLVNDKLVITFSKEKGVAVTEAHCPDLICKNEGYINVTTKAIVCLPSSVTIIITSLDSGNEGWQ